MAYHPSVHPHKNTNTTNPWPATPSQHPHLKRNRKDETPRQGFPPPTPPQHPYQKKKDVLGKLINDGLSISLTCLSIQLFTVFEALGTPTRKLTSVEKAIRFSSRLFGKAAQVKVTTALYAGGIAAGPRIVAAFMGGGIVRSWH